MKILLINAPVANKIKIVREGRCMQREDAWGTSWAPLTLATIAAVLKEAGFATGIKDCTKEDIGLEGLKGIIKEFKPRLVIINTATPSIENDLSCALSIKEVDSSIKTAAFGIHVTALDEECLKSYPCVDFIIRGEPEYTARDLAIAIRDNTPYQDIKGISWQKDGSISRNNEREFIEDLDRLPSPAWEQVNIANYTMPITGEVFLLVMASRGCPHPCTFCAASTLYGKKRRYRSAKRIVDEMQDCKDHFGVSSFLFWAEGFVSDREHVYALCDELEERGLKFKWVANSRVDTVDLALLKRMRKAGCWMIGYGIESGNQDILDLVKKGTTLSQAQEAVRLAREAGIKSTAHVIVGFPGETKEHILRTAAFINKLDVDFLQLYCCVPFPGSVLYSQAKREGLVNTDDWSMFEQNFCVLDTPQISAEEVMRLRKKIFSRFYLHPKRIWRVIRDIRSIKDLQNLLVMAKNFTHWA
ncbi:MAG: radical SAM protein [Candidatus Omnitrophica bacterium]|nr:radical SAM protein [Candidatus Omnitrophota bacterium]